MTAASLLLHLSSRFRKDGNDSIHPPGHMQVKGTRGLHYPLSMRVKEVCDADHTFCLSVRSLAVCLAQSCRHSRCAPYILPRPQEKASNEELELVLDGCDCSDCDCESSAASSACASPRLGQLETTPSEEGLS